MKRYCISAAVLVLATLFSAIAAPPEDTGKGVAIVGARVLSPTGDAWLNNAAVLIVGEKIKKIGSATDLKLESEVHRIDGTGMFVIPGLMDLHTHLCLHPYNETSWNDQVLKESLEMRTIRATAAAKVTLEAGFTTVRELGTEGAGFADVALRDAIRDWVIPGPRVFAATRAIVATSCYGPAGFDPRWQVPQGAQETTGADAMRLAVRQQIAAGADWIKLYGDYRRSPGAQSTATFAPDELLAAVDEAKAAGKPVAVHATTDMGIRRAVDAGVQTIEHGYGASREALELLKQKGVVLCPTLAAAEAVARYAGWDGKDPPPASVQKSRESFRMAHEIGVTIACGSDAGVFSHGENWREIELMVKSGMTPREALAAATSIAAKVIGKEKELGRLEAGCIADVVCIRGDALADVTALSRVAVVVARGRVVREEK